MEQIKNGGPAFPCHTNPRPGTLNEAPQGMTLRDYFAAKALNGMLAHATRYLPRPGASADWHVAIAEEAYELADAVLYVRGGSVAPTEVNVGMLTALEAVLAGGDLSTAHQAIVADAIARALGLSIDEVLKYGV